jgi:hypothetical protein
MFVSINQTASQKWKRGNMENERFLKLVNPSSKDIALDYNILISVSASYLKGPGSNLNHIFLTQVSREFPQFLRNISS